MTLFIERGYAATRLEDVARRAGVVKGTIYLYFADKLALFTAMVEQVIAPLIADDEAFLAEAIACDSPPFERLWRLLQRWGDRLFHTSLGGVVKLVMAEAGNFPEMAAVYHDRVILRAMALVEQVLVEGQQAGDFSAQWAAAPLAQIIVAPLLQRALWLTSFAVVCPNAAAALDEALFWQTYRQWLQRGLMGEIDG